jgi:uncharacterized membrane protein YphA (DoxX/SURF4 family)
MENLAAVFSLLFLAITFIQSGYDKFSDWKGNVNWLKAHFSGTIFEKNVVIALLIVLLIELSSGILCIVGVIEMSISGGKTFGKYGAALGCLVLLMLLFGQRIAKDYEGARTIVIYFIPALMALYWLN